MTTPGEMSDAEAQVLREAAKAAQPDPASPAAAGSAGNGIDEVEDLVPPATGPSG